MNRICKYLYTLGCLGLFLMAFSIPFGFAQNYSGMVSTDPAVEDGFDAGTVHEDEYSDVSLVFTPPAQNTPADVVEIPDYTLESSNYTLGVDDVINISVMRHPEVSGDFIINAEGKIQYEFVGDIKIEGLKKDEVKDILTKELSEYIISPDVTVKITGYNSKIVYVVGEVSSPGKIYMKGDTITVREALVQAGLPLLTAKVGDARLITPSESGKAERKKVNVHKLLYEGDLRENLVMQPGDTLYIPPTFLAKTMRVLQPVAQPIGTAASTGRTVTTGF